MKEQMSNSEIHEMIKFPYFKVINHKYHTGKIGIIVAKRENFSKNAPLVWETVLIDTPGTTFLPESCVEMFNVPKQKLILEDLEGENKKFSATYFSDIYTQENFFHLLHYLNRKFKLNYSADKDKLATVESLKMPRSPWSIGQLVVGGKKSGFSKKHAIILKATYFKNQYFPSLLVIVKDGFGLFRYVVVNAKHAETAKVDDAQIAAFRVIDFMNLGIYHNEYNSVKNRHKSARFSTILNDAENQKVEKAKVKPVEEKTKMSETRRILTPHKHAAVIKAWADGYPIQTRASKTERGFNEWRDNPYPNFSETAEYRIKPNRPDKLKLGMFKLKMWDAPAVAVVADYLEIGNIAVDEDILLRGFVLIPGSKLNAKLEEMYELYFIKADERTRFIARVNFITEVKVSDVKISENFIEPVIRN